MNYDEVSEASKKISEVLKLLIYVGRQKKMYRPFAL